MKQLPDGDVDHGAENGPLDRKLRDALRALAQEQRELSAPSELEDRVLRAWDDAHRTTFRRGSRFGGLLRVAATAVLAAAALGYWTSTARKPSATPTMQRTVSAPWLSDDTLVWLGADPASLQVVRIRVASTALARHGYTVNDPDGDGLVEIEMIVGNDGIAQSVRLSPATGQSSRRE